ELEPEEREAAKSGRLEIEGYRFARDAVAVVVHPSNRLENISLEEVRRIYRGVVRRWDAVGGPGLGIEPVIPPPGGDLADDFAQTVMNGEAMEAPAAYAASDSEVLSFVAGHAGAIGFVSRGWEEARVKALRLASIRGLRYWRPDPEAVYRGEYPLTRPMNLYVR